jgi:hypothetical protein
VPRWPAPQRFESSQGLGWYGGFATNVDVPIDHVVIADFCRRWKTAGLAPRIL